MHAKFPITAGAHATSCNTCHGDFDTFQKFTCFNCHGHDQPITDEIHRSLVTVTGSLPDGGAGYSYASASCLSCHASGARVAFDHVGVTSSCATCHGSGAPFDPLPVAGVGLDGGAFAHPDRGGNDCRACHTTANWTGAGGAPDGARDPSQDVTVTAQIPAYAGTTIASLTPQSELLPMPMVHSSGAFSSSVACVSCHAGANTGTFFPGQLHAALGAAGAPQPSTCLDCHAQSVPTGFVGPVDAARTPASGAMKHDAVLWSNGSPIGTAAVPQECSACHQAPPAAPSWATSSKFHTAMAASQPSSCLDCHANSRPGAKVTSVNPAWTFDHSSGPALGDCATCHLNGSPTRYTAWSGGRFHPAAAATPSTCLPCHSGERPVSTTGWDPSYVNSPFDYVQDASGAPTHGAGQDCAACHAGPGTGAWGGTQNWKGGHLDHAASAVAAVTCIACHTTQRPDRNGVTPAQIPFGGKPFDHSINGTGDCFGCHQATVGTGRYASFQPIPGSDWTGGIGYPGSFLISAPTQFITLLETTLIHSGVNNLVTGTSTLSATLYNAMLHDITDTTVMPAEVYAGPSSSPNYGTCWHCHTHDASGNVTSLADGQFHSSLTSYQATVGATVQPLAQPTRCNFCHAQMRPSGIVEQAASELQPMDHGAQLNSGALSGLDCSTCHSSPGSTWADGVLHKKIGAAQPLDCTVCHYSLMADAAKSDITVTSGVTYSMKHGSGQITFQNCQVCHTSALANGTAATLASTLWKPGGFHSRVPSQPAACNECHAPVSLPATATQSTVSYTLAAGATGTNQRQWMSHASASTVGKDCAVCHAADAVAGVTAWSKSDSYHAAVAASKTCNDCHGLANGGGSSVGTNNNLPAGPTSSSMVSSAASDPASGVPAGTHDQIAHTDLNATSHECSFCHTQAGPSTTPGIQGQEWAQAAFHTSFTGGSTMVINGTSARCSNCHLNVKPPAGFTLQDHSAFTATSAQDCSSCHSWPGTGTAQLPNWLGATSVPQYISNGGFIIPVPPAPASATQTPIPNLPHPAVPAGTACTACHTGAGGGKPATGYDHLPLSQVDTNCNACHEAGSNLVGTLWNGSSTLSGGAGDTRPFTVPSVPATYKGNTSTETTPNHFYLDKGGAQVDCKWCHVNPSKTTTVTATVTTGAAYCCGSTSAWRFQHPPESPTYNFCWQCHINGPPQ